MIFGRFAYATAFLAIFAASSAEASLAISSKPTKNVTCSAGVCQAAASIAVLNVGDLTNLLAAGDVAVMSGSVAHDIELDAALSWTSASRLTLDSYFSIFFSGSIVVAGPGSLMIKTNTQARTADYHFFKKAHIEFWDMSSGLSINGASYVIESKFSTLVRHVNSDPNGNYALARSIRAGRRTYSSSPIPGFVGNFEGLGNTIANLSIDGGSNVRVGLFGTVTGQAVVRDIGLTNVNVTGSGENGIGALAGLLYASTVKHAYATGQVSGAANALAGGLVGESQYSVITNSYADTHVSAGENSSAGGLVGFFFGIANALIDNSYATGSVSAGGNANAGGLAGLNSGAITNTYATGPVTADAGASVGGLIGQNIDTKDSKPFLSDVYTTSSLSAGSGATIGGVIGEDVADSSFQDAYWDLDATGISDPHRGAGNITDDDGISGLTTGQFKSGLPAGFSTLFWAENVKHNDGYPYLLALP